MQLPAGTVRSASGCGTTAANADERTLAVWREWLAVLTTNAEAAMAAALAYQQLDEGARDNWIAALADDADQARVPRFAVYAPLLAVEHDDERRKRIRAAIGMHQPELTPRHKPRALVGRQADGLRIAVIVRPLYLDFVEVLACAFDTAYGFEWVKQDPIVGWEAAPQAGELLNGIRLEASPLKTTIDRLAQAIVAHRRVRGALPDALSTLADLFGPEAQPNPCVED